MIPPIILIVISPVLCYHCQLTFLALVIYCLYKMAYEPWNKFDDNRSSSPPPPIPFLEMEVKAKIAQSNEDVGLWLSKI